MEQFLWNTHWDFLIHISFILFTFAFLIKDIFWLRAISIIASMTEIGYWSLLNDPLWIYIEWHMALIAVNSFRLIALMREHRTVYFNEDEWKLFETLFKNFSKLEFQKLLKAGHWQEAEQGLILTEEGKIAPNIFLIRKGIAEVIIGGKVKYRIKDGQFVGEMGFVSGISGIPARATVKAVGRLKVIKWSQRKLKNLLCNNPTMHIAMQGLICEDILKKMEKSQKQ